MWQIEATITDTYEESGYEYHVAVGENPVQLWIPFLECVVFRHEGFTETLENAGLQCRRIRPVRGS